MSRTSGVPHQRPEGETFKQDAPPPCPCPRMKRQGRDRWLCPRCRSSWPSSPQANDAVWAGTSLNRDSGHTRLLRIMPWPNPGSGRLPGHRGGPRSAGEADPPTMGAGGCRKSFSPNPVLGADPRESGDSSTSTGSAHRGLSAHVSFPPPVLGTPFLWLSLLQEERSVI